MALGTETPEESRTSILPLYPPNLSDQAFVHPDTHLSELSPMCAYVCVYVLFDKPKNIHNGNNEDKSDTPTIAYLANRSTLQVGKLPVEFVKTMEMTSMVINFQGITVFDCFTIHRNNNTVLSFELDILNEKTLSVLKTLSRVFLK